MLPRWVQVFLTLLLEAWATRRDAQVQFLMLQIELLRQKLPGGRVILAPADRLRLLRAGKAMNHAVQDVLGIVSVKTYRRWMREQARGRAPGRVGRPRSITKSLRAIILRLVSANPGWGVRRIVGELRKLALRPSRSSVRRVLVEEGLMPDPARHAPRGGVTPWRTFVAAHANCMVAADFFCKTLWTPLGRQVAYALVFVHLGSRKAFVSPSTCHPTGDWVRQQARNVSMWAQEQKLDLRFLIHDRDTKFTAAFDEHFQQAGGAPGVVKTPFRAPIANAFAESWIGKFKREALNHFFCFSLGHLDHIAQTYVRYYNTVRPHQGLGNVPLAAYGLPPPAAGPDPVGPIRRQRWLGGLLNHYYRSAA
jgi:putative transposase